MDIVKVGKASEFLMKSEKAKEVLIDAFCSGTMEDDIRNRLSLVQEIAEFCERDETEMTLVRGVVSFFLENRKPTSEDVREILDILSECQKDLKDYVIEKTHLSSPRSEEFNEYYAAISEYVKAKEESTREQKKELVRKQIFQAPSLYVTRLAEILQANYGKEGFSISSTLQYVNELSVERKIITVGGPQGRERYCFPNPRMIPDSTIFYHQVLAYEGIVQEKVTSRFNSSEARRYRDIFLVDGIERPILLVVDYGKLHNIERNLIRSYGDFEPLDYLVKTERIIPKDQDLNMEILIARKVARVANGHEEELWLDEQRARLS